MHGIVRIAEHPYSLNLSMFMKKIFILLITSLLIISCTSKEIILKKNRIHRYSDIEIITETYLDIWEMVLIPEGYFIMGSDYSFPDESPAHEVFLPAYYIDKFEVTCYQYQLFCNSTGHPAPRDWPGGICPEYKLYQPVRWVSYEDAQAYAQWMGKQLPSEQQWEKAARGVDLRTFPWGNDWNDQYCRSAEQRFDIPQLIGWYGAFGASPWGVYDMAGNIAEWTSTWYNSYPGSSAQSEYFGSIVKVIRGGSYMNTKDLASVTYRGIHYPSIPSPHLGFRCVYLPVGMDSLPIKIHLEPGGIIEW